MKKIIILGLFIFFLSSGKAAALDRVAFSPVTTEEPMDESLFRAVKKKSPYEEAKKEAQEEARRLRNLYAPPLIHLIPQIQLLPEPPRMLPQPQLFQQPPPMFQFRGGGGGGAVRRGGG